MMILAKALGGQSEEKLLNIHGKKERERERQREREREKEREREREHHRFSKILLPIGTPRPYHIFFSS